MPHDFMIYIIKYGYLAIFLFVFLQGLGIPIPVPNELVLVFSGYLSFTHQIRFALVLLTAITADFLSATALYFVFYFFASYIIEHKPKWLPISTATLYKLKTRASNKGLWSTFLGRLLPFIKLYITIKAGMTQLKPRIFLPIAFLSAILGCCIFVYIGFFLGPYWLNFLSYFNTVKSIAIPVVLALVLILGIRYYRKRYKPKDLDQKYD